MQEGAGLSSAARHFLRVFAYGHNKDAALDPHCCLDNLLRLFATCKLGGFLPLKGPGPAIFGELWWAAQVTPRSVPILGAVYYD